MKKSLLLFAAIFLATVGLFAQLQFEPGSVDFGQHPITSTTNIEVVLTSQINQQITLSGLSTPFSATPASFAIVIGEQKTITITFNPQSEGPFDGTLTATGSIWGTTQMQVSGYAIPATLSFSQPELDFGTILMTGHSEQMVTVQSDIAQQITLNSLDLPFTASPLVIDVMPDVPAQVFISFDPASPGYYQAYLEATGSLSGSSQMIVYGWASEASIFAFPQTCNFDPLFSGETDTLEVIMTTDINQDIALSGLSDIFSFYPENLTMTAGDPQTISVIFSPVNPGFYNQTLQLTGSLWGTLFVPVSGECIYPMITVSPDYLDFGDVPLLSTATLQITILNSGNVSLECCFANNNTHFGVSSPTLSIPENSSQQLDITFTPDFTPAEYDTLLITTNDPENPLVRIPLLGQGVSHVSGEVCGTWYKANSPYNFSGSVNVPANCTLTIEPGTVVNMFDYDFTVNGKLVCNGLINDSIRLNGTGTFQLSSSCPSDSIDYVAIDGGSTGIDGMMISSFGAKIKNSNILAYQIINGNDLFYDDFEDGTWNDKWMIVINNSGSISVGSSYGIIGQGMMLNNYMNWSGSSYLEIKTKPITVIKPGYLKVLLNYKVIDYYGHTSFLWRVNNGEWNQFYEATYTNNNWLQLNYQISSLFQQDDLIEFMVSNHRSGSGTNNHQIYLDEVKIKTNYWQSISILNSSLNLGSIDNFSKSIDASPSLQINNSKLELVENIESHPDHSAIDVNNSIISQAGSNAVRTNGKYSGVTLNHVTIENAAGNAIFTNADSSSVLMQNGSIQNCVGSGIYVVGNYSPVTMDSIIVSKCLRGISVNSSTSPVTITHSSISNNNSEGIYISGGYSPVIVSNSIISNNNSHGIYINGQNSLLTLDNSEIFFNNGNGISCTGYGNSGQMNEITQSNIYGNENTGIYGGNSLFIANTVVNKNGSNGLEGENLIITNSFVNSNENNGIAAAVVNIQYSIVSSNKANGICADNFYGNHITSIYNHDKGLVAYTYGLLLNSIICSNAQYGSQYSGSLEYFYSKVMGDPKLADSLGHLLPTSPCIDAADPEEEDANIPFGMGTIRSDMGAYGGPENWVWGGNPAPTDGAAKIVNIVDLPQDQGKMVGIQFNASPFDNGNPAYNVSKYSFWRELDENGKQNIVVSKTPTGQYFQKGAEYWEYVGEMPAMGFQNYGYSAPTLGDSTINGMFWSKFIVVAHTANTSVYWVSLPDSGYSVDNLAPAAPKNLAGTVAGISYNLQWTPNPEEDLQYYAVYRGMDGNFSDVPFATTIQAALPDITLNTDEFEYAVAAFDHSGNQSNLSNAITAPIYDAFTVPQGWSGISSWIIPNQPAIENVLAPLWDDLIILYNQTGVYWPGQNVNTLGDWESHSGYVVKLCSEMALPMVGFKEQNTVFVTNAGWQLLPVLSPCPVPTSGLQVQPAGGVVMIKEIAGWRVYWPEMSIATLGELLPGKAYFVLTGNNGIIGFPACERLKVGYENLTASPDLSAFEITNLSAFKISTTPVTHIIAIPAAITGNLEMGDVIAVFNSSGACAGMINIQDKGQASALTVFGDDPTTSENEGMAEGETLHFKVYKSKTGTFADAEVLFEPAFPNTSGTFANNGVSAMASLKVGALSTSQIEIEDVQVFPNPGNGKFTVSGISEGNNLVVTDAKGQIIWTGISQTETSIDLSGRPAGLYFLKICRADEINFVKLVVQ